MPLIHETPISISSINRVKYGTSRPDDFKIKLSPSINFSDNMDHKVAMHKISMSYSWHNIRADYNNNKIKYSADGGSTWKPIKSDDGIYDYDDINDVIHKTLENNGDSHSDTDKNPEKENISIMYVLTLQKVLVALTKDFQLDLRDSKFGDLIGFDEKILTNVETSTKAPNITNNIDSLFLKSNLTNKSIVDGGLRSTLAVIPTDNLTRSLPFTYHPPIRLLFFPLSTNNLSELHFYITDSIDRPVNLNGVNWNLELIIKSTPKTESPWEINLKIFKIMERRIRIYDTKQGKYISFGGGVFSDLSKKLLKKGAESLITKGAEKAGKEAIKAIMPTKTKKMKRLLI